MNLVEVLRHIRPDAQWTLDGDEYNGLTWLTDTTPPTLAQCEAAWKEIEHDVMMRPVRAERNRRLEASDWTQVADAHVDARAWAKYRQDLRDLPAKIKDPTGEVAWPEHPK
jgi:hypothetical protein